MSGLSFPMDRAVEVDEKTLIIPLSMIRRLPFNTSVMGDDQFKMLMNDMTKAMSVGFNKIDPILVRRLTPEEAEEEEKRSGRKVLYEIVDGHKRFEAAALNGWSHIKARLIEASREEALIINYRKNRERGEVDEVKEALFFRFLIEDMGYTVLKVAEAFGLTEDAVKAIIAKAPVSREARRLLLGCRKKIPPKLIEAMSGAPERVQAEMARAFIDLNFPLSRIDRLRDLLCEGKSLSEAAKAALGKPDEEKPLKVSAASPAARAGALPEPVKKPALPEPIKKPVLPELVKAEAKQAEVGVEAKPSEASVFACPSCGRRIRVDWDKKVVEWV